MTDVQNIVLVHGGFVDGSGWRGVYDLLTADQLTADRFNVSVVQNQTLSLESDVETTRNVLQAARELSLQRNIFVSSMAVFDYRGLGRNDALQDNAGLEAAPEERSAYAEAKTRAERLVAEELAGKSPNWMILRPSQIFGTGDLAAPLGTRLGRNLIVLGGPRKWLRMVHVDDVARAIVEFLAPGRFQPGAAINFSHPDRLPAHEVADLFRRHCGFRVHYLPPWLGRTLAWGTRVVHAVLRRGPRISNRQAAYLFCECSVEVKSAMELGWRPAAPLALQIEITLQDSKSLAKPCTRPS